MDEQEKKTQKTPEEQIIKEGKEKLFNIISKAESTSSTSPETGRSQEKEEVLNQSIIDQIFSEAIEEQITSLPEIPEQQQSLPQKSQKKEDSPDLKELEDKVVLPPKHEDKEVILLSQDEIEELLKLAQQEQKEKQKKKQEALEKLVPTSPSEPTKQKEKPTIITVPIHRNILVPLALSTLVGITVALLTYQYLKKNAVEIPREIQPSYITNLNSAIEYAEMLINTGRYTEAASLIENVLQKNKNQSEERTTLKYLLIKSKYLSGNITPHSEEFQNLISDIDELIKESPRHPLAPLILFYKAKLYEMEDFPYPAIETYERIFQNYPSFEKMDDVLISLSNLELAQNNPVKSTQWAQQLIKNFPNSPHKIQVMFNIGEAYRITGLSEDARTIFVRLIETDPNNPLSSLATVKLAQMAIDQGKYEQALVQLKTKTQIIRSFKYNDQVYFLLGKTLYLMGKLEDAKNVLQELITFFPESDVHPQAWILLSQVLNAMGNADEAFQTAEEAARKYPNNPEVIANKAEFFALQGNSYASAIAYLEAENKGGKNPQYLLRAGRYLLVSKEYEEALKAFEELKKRYYGTKETLWGNIEKVKCLLKLKRLSSALSELETLKGITNKMPSEKIEVLNLLLEVYTGLSLYEKAEEIGLQLLSLVETDEEKANILLSIIDFANIDNLKDLVSTLNFSKIPLKNAYSLLLKYGEKLLTVNPSEGIEILEHTYLQYPELITSHHRSLLLEAYIKSDKYSSALRIIKDWENQLLDSDDEREKLIDAEIMWGDYTYKKGDKTAAKEAYKTAIILANDLSETKNDKKHSIDWAKIQYANILMDNLNYDEALKIFEEISKSPSPYADLAKLTLNQATLEKNLIK